MIYKFILFNRWWKKSDFGTKVPYARDRIVEVYFWLVSISYEPRNSTARKLATKLGGCISLLDDTYDNFATVEELEIFTQAIKRLISIQKEYSHILYYIFSIKKIITCCIASLI
jgi:hypothetical protein